MRFKKSYYATDPREELKQTLRPRMANYFQSLQGNYFPKLYENSFREDLALGIMPYSSDSGTGKAITVEIEGIDKEIERTANFLSDFCEHEPRNETDLIFKAVNGIAQDLSWNGRAFYEILSSSDKTGEKEYFARNFIDHNLVKIPFYKYIQIVPKADRQSLKTKFLVCPSKEVFEISMPRKLGGVERFRKIKNNLGKYSGVGPEFFQIDPYHEINKDFDFSFYKRNQMVYGFSITKKWGWNFRNLANEYQNEFYTVYRYLTFKWAKAIMRNHIINELKKLVKRLEMKTLIKIEGLIEPGDILLLRDKLINGEIDFESALNKFTNDY